jgi:uncharacterized DUF497 family protein
MDSRYDFEWDEFKRLSNLAKHGFDFVAAVEVFEGARITREVTHSSGELRPVTIGMIGDIIVAVVYTVRGDVIRVISLRRARRDERQKYREIFGRGT